MTVEWTQQRGTTSVQHADPRTKRGPTTDLFSVGPATWRAHRAASSGIQV